VVADGEKSKILTDDQLSTLFDTPIKLVHANGFYQAIPGTLQAWMGVSRQATASLPVAIFLLHPHEQNFIFGE
jgi:hypothetical protein